MREGSSQPFIMALNGASVQVYIYTVGDRMIWTSIIALFSRENSYVSSSSSFDGIF